VRIDGGKSVSSPLIQGQEIAPVSHRRVPHSATSQERANGTLPPLKLGQELEALIVEELDGGRLLLKAGAALIEADGPNGLGRGQHLRLRVEQLQPHVLLHVIEVEPSLETEATRLLRAHLPVHADSGELLDALQHRIDSFIGAGVAQSAEKLAKLRESLVTLLVKGTPPTPENLKSLARDGGLFYEAKLFNAASNQREQVLYIADHDLKGLLLAALEEAKTRPFSTGLQNALSAQLDNLEAQQATNMLAQLSGGVIQLQIPFFDGARFSTVALAVESDGRQPEGKRGKKGRGYSVLFMLDLENFGRTRIDAHVSTKEIRAILFVDEERSLQLIRQELPGFRQTLIALGYESVALAAKPLRDLPLDKQEKFAALSVGAPSAVHLLDFKA
jgi:hypothetical protein